MRCRLADSHVALHSDAWHMGPVSTQKKRGVSRNTVWSCSFVCRYDRRLMSPFCLLTCGSRFMTHSFASCSCILLFFLKRPSLCLWCRRAFAGAFIISSFCSPLCRVAVNNVSSRRVLSVWVCDAVLCYCPNFYSRAPLTKEFRLNEL